MIRASQITTILLGVLFIALLAQLTLTLPDNLGGIPITGQSLAVLLVGLLFPIETGAVAVGLYLLLGALGLPVYADGGSGWKVLSGGSGGFLIGFLLAAIVMGRLNEKNWHETFFRALLAMLIGTLIILCCGVFRLTLLYGFEQALDYGFYPFWQGALVKVLLGALMVSIFVRMKKTMF